jgi:hypothetical protein
MADNFNYADYPYLSVTQPSPSYTSSTGAVGYGSGLTTTANTIMSSVLYNGQVSRNPKYDCDLCGVEIHHGVFWEVLANGTFARPFCSNNCRMLTFQADARLELEALKSLGVIVEEPDA